MLLSKENVKGSERQKRRKKRKREPKENKRRERSRRELYEKLERKEKKRKEEFVDSKKTIILTPKGSKKKMARKRDEKEESGVEWRWKMGKKEPTSDRDRTGDLTRVRRSS